MEENNKVLLAGIAAFLLMAWIGSWAFTQINGYPIQWYWLPAFVTSAVAGFAAYARFSTRQHANKKN